MEQISLADLQQAFKLLGLYVGGAGFVMGLMSARPLTCVLERVHHRLLVYRRFLSRNKRDGS